MIRKVLIGLGVLVVLVLGVVGWGYWEVGRIAVEKVTDNLYMMSGVGGNVGVLVTDEGVVVVDTMTFARQGAAIRARIREITDKPIAAVVNTHYHIDHTHGNPAFDPGTMVVATTKTLEHLKTRDADYWRDNPAAELLPNVTFDGERELSFGGEAVRLFHPGRGHTDGDLIVDFASERVIHTGDLFSNGVFPNIDLEAGGSVEQWEGTLSNVLARSFDRVIPGHGPLSDRAGIERYRDFVHSLWAQTSEIVRRGASLGEAQKTVDLDAYHLEPIWFVPTLNRNFVIQRAYEEATEMNRDGGGR